MVGVVVVQCDIYVGVVQFVGGKEWCVVEFGQVGEDGYFYGGFEVVVVVQCFYGFWKDYVGVCFYVGNGLFDGCVDIFGGGCVSVGYDDEIVIGVGIYGGFYVVDYFVGGNYFFVWVMVVVFLVDLVFQVYGGYIGFDE